MPAGRAPHKEIEQDPGAGERLRLCELAAAEVEGVEVSRYEVDKAEPAYTFETLEWLRAEQPDDELVFIAGADQAASLPQLARARAGAAPGPVCGGRPPGHQQG